MFLLELLLNVRIRNLNIRITIKLLKVLRSRIYEMELQKKLEEDAKNRKTMVSSGDRSAKLEPIIIHKEE